LSFGNRRAVWHWTARQRLRAITNSDRRFRAFVHLDGSDVILDRTTNPANISLSSSPAVLLVHPERDSNGASWLQPEFMDQRRRFQSGHDTCTVILSTLPDVPGIDVPTHDYDLFRVLGTGDFTDNVRRGCIGFGVRLHGQA